LDVAQGEVLRTNSLVGSVHYLAPEVLSVHDSYDVMADWWAFGVLLYDMLVCISFFLFY
jgi:serine/threonine protein kinase